MISQPIVPQPGSQESILLDFGSSPPPVNKTKSQEKVEENDLFSDFTVPIPPAALSSSVKNVSPSGNIDALLDISDTGGVELMTPNTMTKTSAAEPFVLVLVSRYVSCLLMFTFV